MLIITNDQVNYAGKQLPRDKVNYVQPAVDYANNPSSIILAGMYLPPDTQIYINGEKVIAVDDILDGDPVFERISNKPIEVEFEGTVRDRQYNDAGQPGTYIFPQQVINDIWTNIWMPGTVQKVQNTLLNGLGIFELVVMSINKSTVRGSTNVPFRIRTYENKPGQSLIVQG